MVLLGILVTGSLIAMVLWPAGSPRPEQQPGNVTAESADETPPGQALPVGDDVCDVGEPHFRGSMRRDGLLHGGGLGMPMPSGLQFGDPARMPYAFDVAVVRTSDAETWAGVGAVRIDDPYMTPEQASSTVTACLAKAYADSQLEVTRAHFTQIPGVREAHQRTGFVAREGASRDFRVLIADTGSPESLAVYVRVSTGGTPEAQALADAESGLAKQ